MSNTPKDKSMLDMQQSSFLDGSNALYIEALYEQYLTDPNSIEGPWREYFEKLAAENQRADVPHTPVRDAFRQLKTGNRCAEGGGVSPHELRLQEKQVRVAQLINAYRAHGHKRARFNPLTTEGQLAQVPELTQAHHQLTDDDLDHTFDTGMLAGVERAPLREILSILKRTYTHAIGSEYLHVAEKAEELWLRERIEQHHGQPDYPQETKLRLLDRLTAAEGLERFLHSKYIGQKRFSLEGGDSLIPMLDTLIQHAGAVDAKEVLIAMAHRGRLNVLVNILGKHPKDLFQEFEGQTNWDGYATGDVKYHQGFSSDINTPGSVVHTSLAFNPSHLEIVGPVVEGSTRARQDRRNDSDGCQVIPVIIHGDAAFAGQGVVMETFNMSQSRGYSTKGTLHIVINNQIGFTTSNQRDSRSTMYCTDVAKMVNAPIFHVNGDNPEAVQFVTELALEYRMTFKKDVVIDLVCYRRHGHSEADEPMATQPEMYQNIKKKKTPRDIYASRLIDAGLLDAATVKQMMKDYRATLEQGRCVVKEVNPDYASPHTDWNRYTEQACTVLLDTGVDKKRLQFLAEKQQQMPDNFTLHPAVRKIYESRAQMAAEEVAADWGFAETLAYATLVDEGHHVRLSGQDCGRGTFFHRHVVTYNQSDNRAFIPLRHIKEDQGNFLVINSVLSEAAVLAFEYGYATTDPNTLTIWEAQFGDFANNAQVVIDQFISAGEQKWKRLCGLVLLLPHGYEGQGPEHSSARVERYLQLCAQHNMQVVMPTTPAQIFHLLRRQMMLNCRKPLVVFSPKSLLRHKMATSTLNEMTEGTFRPIIPEVDELDPDGVKRVVMCSGKVYYDLLLQRREQQRTDVAIIRMEQLYPFPSALMKRELERYSQATEFYWCQEEPKNQGSWFTSQHHVRSLLDNKFYLEYAGRPFSAAPAVGYPKLHKEQQRQLVEDALGPQQTTKDK
ncbi:2-oxoglutarate dehydrogenase E1 component [hydrothermal vent metagenome]|uniref:oxoglutarate dehydrogenase (succinyl-transferring) n=1 Tax=hydrothermal vent metagenome TaxID=652676 RepID=A0A3B0Z9F2_9ZZZZ